jgi:NMD protein affecting ribosome stability and mRNA decay
VVFGAAVMVAPFFPNTVFMARDKENVKRLQKEWYEKNKELTKERAKNWVEENPEKRKAAANKYAKNNPERLRNNALKSQYGITLEEFNRMKSDQQNRCGICGSEFKNTKHTHLDHCHTTGKIRAILCGSCNKGLGHFKDSVLNLLSAARYLIKHQS